MYCLEDNIIRKIRFHKVYFLFVIALAILAAGCSSRQTPTAASAAKPATSTAEPVKDTPSPALEDHQITRFGPLCKAGLSYVRFPDGSELYLAPETEIEISSLADLSTGTSGHEILLKHGQLVIVSQLPPGSWFRVLNPRGNIAQLDGLIMHVRFDKDTGEYAVICVDGACELGSGSQSLFQFAATSKAWFDENGDFQGPYAVDINELREGCDKSYILVNIPVTPTPDLGATATAFCGNYEEENPGTPCP